MKGIEFKKGEPKRAGRKKGVPNKKTIITVEYFEAVLNQFPPAYLVKLVQKVKDPARQAQLLLDMMEFIVPKKSRVHVVNDNSNEDEQIFLIDGQTINF